MCHWLTANATSSYTSLGSFHSGGNSIWLRSSPLDLSLKTASFLGLFDDSYCSIVQQQYGIPVSHLKTLISFSIICFSSPAADSKCASNFINFSSMRCIASTYDGGKRFWWVICFKCWLRRLSWSPASTQMFFIDKCTSHRRWRVW